ncbi:hypothetical protein [Massilia antarctica]|uniref:hypothetical protein n=1 Tax=Massilia antarctica TaxID=2765360 RepID=UPI0006BB6699|nr:hypothetical protein [Massilia sp. H27-R4]MCY0913247.1 hypothetical protein [Massilia sp. H27-R4]CUI07872.1 hypothetical protein BN2497_10521 [Janthinobacterium sp. CG23_2]CUU31658.1 hypothetical protein BN3177_10521 [Janthinobacterium sp. CG23_2]
MELVEIEILGLAITHDHGTLGEGDVLRTSPEFARHLIEDCKVARYSQRKTRTEPEPVLTADAPAAPEPAAEQAAETHEDEPAAVQKLNKKR